MSGYCVTTFYTGSNLAQSDVLYFVVALLAVPSVSVQLSLVTMLGFGPNFTPEVEQDVKP